MTREVNRLLVFRALAGLLAVTFIAAGVLFYGHDAPCLSWLGFGGLLALVAATGLGLSRLNPGDSYRVVLPGDHTLKLYPCGVRAGERLRLKRDLDVLDPEGRQTGHVIARGTVWTVLAGLPEEPDVVWLEQPDGETHTWDDRILGDFERFEAPAS